MPKVSRWNNEQMRGLAKFVADIRNCKSKEAECKRINKELANIRSKFKGDKTLDGYQRKKYVCKLLFIFLLGNDIDFGHKEAVNLLCSNQYTDKHIGYLFISVLFHEHYPLMNLIINQLETDLKNHDPVIVNLALQFVANSANREIGEHFINLIPQLMFSSLAICEYVLYFMSEHNSLAKGHRLSHSFSLQPLSSHFSEHNRQSAILCMLRLIRVVPDRISYDDWSLQVIQLINDKHIGVATIAVSLIDALVKHNPDQCKGCVRMAVKRLERLTMSSFPDLQDYSYYFVPAPWFSVKLLRLLQNYPPPEDLALAKELNDVLKSILDKVNEPPRVKKPNHANAKNAILFEAINLIIHLDCHPDLLVQASNQLGQFIQAKDANLRYLALESLCLLATSELSHDAVKKHQETVIAALHTEHDISVRQRQVDLLYAICDRSNAQGIVGEMLAYLDTADYSIREKMVLKVAILAEKYATDYAWYVDTMLHLTRVAGDYVSDEVWYRVIQLVVNHDDIQGYAAKTVFEALQAPACHENMVKIGAYILGEFGNLIAGDARSSSKVQFDLLHSKFYHCTPATRQLMLSTYVKFSNLFPEIKSDIQDVLTNDINLRSSSVEIQQRASEYLALSQKATNDVLATVLEEMPPFPERESSILNKLKSKTPASEAILHAKHERSTDSPVKPSGGKAAQQIDLKAAPSNGGGNEVDLLDLDLEPARSPVAATANNTDIQLLSDLLGDVGNNEHSTVALGASNAITLANPLDKPCNVERFASMICHSKGILFENANIQIGYTLESIKYTVQLKLFYGNKSALPLNSFNVAFSCSDAVELLTASSKALDIKPLASAPSVIASGEQTNQSIQINCISPSFHSSVQAVITFEHAGEQYRLVLLLPIALNVFLEPTEMDANTFFSRWQGLREPEQQGQKLFRATASMDQGVVSEKLKGFRLNLLNNVDTNPSNYVGAAVLKTSTQDIGLLMRLEGDLQSQMYRLTIRGVKDIAVNRICDLLERAIQNADPGQF